MNRLIPGGPPDTRRGTSTLLPGRGRLALLVLTVSGTIAVTATAHHAVAKIAVLFVSTGACAALVLVERRRPRLGVRTVALAIGVVMVVAVAIPPRSSNDLWSYTMYGRMIAVHGASPYDKTPADFPTDPFSARVSPRWAHQGSVYGPMFVAIAATGSLLSSDSPLLSRLFFQLTAALALFGILYIVWRRTRSPAVLIWLGLNPVCAVVVNGGHNDAMVGVALLVATVLVAKGRGGSAGILIGLATLIKFTALLGLVGATLWAWRSGRRRLALTTASTTGLVVILGYLPVLGSASHVLGKSNQTVTDASVWNPLADLLLGHEAWRDVPHPMAPNATLAAIFLAAAASVALLAVVLGWRAAASPQPEPAVGNSAASYTMAAGYTFPWYAIWALPLFASRRITAVAWVVWIQSIVLLAALKLPNHPTASAPEAVFRTLLTQVAPVVLLVCFIAAALYERGLHRTSPSGTALGSAGSRDLEPIAI
jgi:Glycosyltransferase family 87